MQENKDPIKQAAGKFVKKKILLFIAPALPAIFIFLLVAAFIGIVIYPVVKGGQLVAGIAGFWDRLTNTITLKCLFCTDDELVIKKEEKFYKKVKKINETYLSGKNMEGTAIQLDIPLLLSAVFYTENIDETIFDDADNTDQSEEDAENMDDVTSGDTLGDLSWYYDQSDQKSIHWFKGATEEEGCYILGYYYHEKEQFTIGKKSKLRRLAKHMVKKIRNGTCTAMHDKEGNFTGWSISEWSEYVLDISRDDTLYTLQFDQQPYKNYRTKSEVASLPPAFLTYLISTYLPEQFSVLLPPAVKDLSEQHEIYLSKRKVMKNFIYSYKAGYEYLVGNNYEFGAICGEINGDCSYSVKIAGNKTVNAGNIKVKLLQCADGTRGQPIEGESLVDFEKYITGVVYAENGGAPYEGLKAQAIAARSYALMRGEKMGTSYLRIYQENGQWILPIRNCTEDQVYCDPDQGCTITKSGNTVHSGKQSGGTYKPALSADSNIRKAVAETTGKVLTDSSGNIFYTPFTNVTQEQWNAAAKNGSDAYEALVETYGTGNVVKSSCTGNVGSTINSGSEKYYNQGDYSYVPYCSGGSTVATSGCLPTAYAMVVENLTGKVTTPQTVAEYICNDVNGSKKYRVDGSGTSSDFVLDQATQSHFKISARRMSVNERSIDNIIEILKSGKSIIASVKGTGTFATENGHYIILSSVTPDGKIKVLDPGHRSATKAHSTSVIQSEVLNKLNYTMIEVYGSRGGTVIDSCYTGATGDYVGWRQYDKTWGSTPLGSGGYTIKSAGCLATSVAKLIAMSGTQVTISSFNPGNMVKYLNTHGGFSGSNWIWNSPQASGLAPNFQHGGSVSLRGKSEAEKIATVKQYLDQGYYLALQVKCDGTEEPGQHWVAVLGVTNTDIVMSDPASDKTNVWDKYKSGGTVQFHYYKKND